MTKKEIFTVILIALLIVALFFLRSQTDFFACQVLNLLKTGQWFNLPSASFWSNCGAHIVR